MKEIHREAVQSVLLIDMAHALFINCAFSEKVPFIKHLNISRMTEERLALDMQATTELSYQLMSLES